MKTQLHLEIGVDPWGRTAHQLPDKETRQLLYDEGIETDPTIADVLDEEFGSPASYLVICGFKHALSSGGTDHAAADRTAILIDGDIADCAQYIPELGDL